MGKKKGERATPAKAAADVGKGGGGAEKGSGRRGSGDSSWWVENILRVALLISICLFAWSLKERALEYVTPKKIMGRILARRLMNWQSSTTSAPISVASVLAKQMIVQSEESWPRGLKAIGGLQRDRSGWVHSTSMRGARAFVDSLIVEDLKKFCTGYPGCDFNEKDPEFGTTALHMAALYGNGELSSYLLENGADPAVVDSWGRKASNVTFSNFVENSRAAARARGSSCEIPEVHVTDEDSLREVRRLVGEGEPVIARNLLPWLTRDHQLLHATPEAFVNAFGSHAVSPSGIPYAMKFNVALEDNAPTLRDFYDHHMQSREGGAKEEAREKHHSVKSSESGPGSTVPQTRRGRGGGTFLHRIGSFFHRVIVQKFSRHRDPKRPHPAYVFEQDGPACQEGFRLLNDFVRHALPVSDGRTPGGIMCPPSRAGLDAMHYYMGDKGTGAPFHVHSDALNLLLTGSKRWWIVPPQLGSFSRMHIEEWVQQGQHRGGRAMLAPLECVQNAGDVVYVPFDWGHAAINEDDGVFGYTMELTNRRDTLMSSLSRSC